MQTFILILYLRLLGLWSEGLSGIPLSPAQFNQVAQEPWNAARVGVAVFGEGKPKTLYKALPGPPHVPMLPRYSSEPKRARNGL